MSIETTQFRLYIVRRTLQRLEPAIPYSQAAENLLIGTALQESAGLKYIDQLAPGPGPAYGLFQMEKATHDDLWKNFIPNQPGLAARLYTFTGEGNFLTPPVEELYANNGYAAAMCRVHYRRVPENLPWGDDALALATYWKRYYNTVKGAGTVERALPYFKTAAEG